MVIRNGNGNWEMGVTGDDRRILGATHPITLNHEGAVLKKSS